MRFGSPSDSLLKPRYRGPTIGASFVCTRVPGVIIFYELPVTSSMMVPGARVEPTHAEDAEQPDGHPEGSPVRGCFCV